MKAKQSYSKLHKATHPFFGIELIQSFKFKLFLESKPKLIKAKESNSNLHKATHPFFWH